MKNDTSIFEIFQDPLLTIVALILLGTSWIILPREEGKGGRGLGALPELQESVDHLKQRSASLGQRVEEMMQRIRQLTDNLHALYDSEQVARESAQGAGLKADALMRQIAGLKSDILGKRDELRMIETRLEKARRAAKQEALVDELDRRIGSLKDEIAGKELLMKDLEKQLELAQADLKRQRKYDDERKRALDDLQKQLITEKNEHGRAEFEKGRLEQALRELPGFGEYATVGDKVPILLDIIDNRILEINDQNYTLRSWLAPQNREVVQVIEATKKRPGSGETLERIEDPNSDFQRLLKNHRKEKYYLAFWIHRDFFTLFHKARQIAWKHGYQVDWNPRDDGALHVGIGGSGGGNRAR